MGIRTSMNLDTFLLGMGVSAFVVIRLLSAVHFEVVFDEVFTLAVVEHDWSNLASTIARHDYHPPLFYALLKLWIGIGGTSVVWLGLLPTLFGAAAVVPVLLLCREVGLSRRAMALAIALMAPNGFLIGYAQELRMYSLLLFLAATSMWLFTLVLHGDRARRTWVALTVVNVLIAYTQYYGWLLIASEGLVVLAWRRAQLLRFTVSTAVVVAAFAPWAWAVFEATTARMAAGQEALYFIAAPNWFSVAGLLTAITGELPFRRATTLNLLFFGLPVVLWCVHMLRSRSHVAASHWALLVLAFAPVVVSYTASHLLGHSVWGQRHLMFIAVPYVLLVVAAVDRLQPGVRRVVSAGMVVWALASAAVALTHPYNQPGWDRLLALATARGGSNQVYAVDEHAGWLLAFHAQRQGLLGLRIVVVKPDTETNRRIFASGDERRPLWASRLPVVFADDAMEFPEGQFWLAHRASRGGIKQCLERAGYQVGVGFTAMSHTRRQSEGIALYPVSRAGATAHVTCQARADGEPTHVDR